MRTYRRTYLTTIAKVNVSKTTTSIRNTTENNLLLHMSGVTSSPGCFGDAFVKDGRLCSFSSDLLWWDSCDPKQPLRSSRAKTPSVTAIDARRLVRLGRGDRL